jgi:YbbR domain-containing protein
MFEQVKFFFIQHSLKFLATVCGFVVWFGVVSGEEARAELELPLRVINLQNNMALVKPLPGTLFVQLEGGAISLINLKLNRSARVEVDLKEMPHGYNRIGSDRFSFISPNTPDIKMLRVRQGALSAELDSRIEQKVPVQSKVFASAANGFTLTGKPKIMPDSIYISGARSAIAEIKSVPTKEVSLTNLKWSNSFSVKLDLASIPSVVDIADTAVFALAQIEPLDHKIFSGIPVRLIGSFERELYSLSPSKADVEISGGKELLSKITPQDINLYIEFSRFSIENTDELKPTVHIPHAVTNWQTFPEKFSINRTAKEDDEE